MGSRKNDLGDDELPGGRRAMWEQMRAQFGHHGHFGRAYFGQRGWLRPSVIRMLEEKPMNGMEMINRFYEESHGWWKPSPGSVYPLLEMLEKEGLIKKKADGRYQMTQKFEQRSIHGDPQVHEMLVNMEGTVSYLEEMKKSNKAKLVQYRKRIQEIRDRLSKL